MFLYICLFFIRNFSAAITDLPSACQRSFQSICVWSLKFDRILVGLPWIASPLTRLLWLLNFLCLPTSTFCYSHSPDLKLEWNLYFLDPVIFFLFGSFSPLQRNLTLFLLPLVHSFSFSSFEYDASCFCSLSSLQWTKLLHQFLQSLFEAFASSCQRNLYSQPKLFTMFIIHGYWCFKMCALCHHLLGYHLTKKCQEHKDSNILQYQEIL